MPNDQDYTEAILNLVRDMPGELRVDQIFQLTVTQGLKQYTRQFSVTDYPFEQYKEEVRLAIVS